MRSLPLRLLLPVAVVTGVVVRRRRRNTVAAPTEVRIERAAPRRHRPGRALALAALVTIVVAPLAPASSEGPCGPAPDGLRLVTASLGGDGDVRDVTSEIVGLDGTRCTASPEPDVDVLGVQVGILHTDTTGAAIEATRLTLDETPVTTRIRVTATGRTVTSLTVDGLDGPTSTSRPLAVPRSVRITIRYPSGWYLTAAPALGTTVRDVRSGVEVTRDAILFPPFTDDHVILVAQAQPGRGTPTVIVESTPADATTLRSLLDRTDDRAALAVIGAFLDLTADGADELVSGAFELADGLDELAEATEDLAAGVDGFADGVEDLLDGVEQLVEGVRELRDGSREFADALDEVATAAPALVTGLDQLIGVVDDLDGLRGLELLAGGLAAGTPEEDPLRTLATGLEEVRAGLSGGLAGIRSGLSALAQGLGALADGADDLAGGVDRLLEGVEELRDGVTELRDGTRELADGTRALADATREVADGARTLAEGAEELPDALREILGIADRRAQTLALDEATVQAALERAELERAGTALVSVRLEHTGQPALPVTAAAATGGIAAVSGLGWFLRRRRTP